jgi:hypothetical protein
MQANPDHYEAYYADKLWQLLPAVYRAEDAEALDQSGPLREMVNRIGAQAAILRRGIDRLWEDQSIETCDDWVIAYIADLLATNLVGGLDARGAPVAAEPLVEQAERHPVATLVEGAEDGLEIRDGAGRPAGRERRFGGPQLERRGDLADRIGTGAAALGSGLGRGRPAALRRPPGRLREGCGIGLPIGSGNERGIARPGRRVNEGERELECGERVLGRMRRFGTTGGVDGCGEGAIRNVRRQPVARRLARMRDKPGRKGEVVTVLKARQEVGGGGPTDVLVAEGHPIGLLDEDPGGDRFLEAGRQVGIERSVGVPGEG